MAKKSAAKKKPPARTKAAPARAAKKAARSKAAARPARRRKAAQPARKPVKKAAPKRRVAGVRAAAKRSANAAAKASAAKLRATKAAASRKLNATRKKSTQRVAGYKAAKTKREKVAAKASRGPSKARKPAPPGSVSKAAPKNRVAAPKAPMAPAARPAPALNRERRTVGEAAPPSTPSSFVSNRHASAASSGADELRVRLASHTGTGPAITAGDVDANWEAAETVGDEAPGGDNPTPDQDVVDEIGRALGVEYDDDEELQGGDEIAARDTDRWELDPASSDDFDER